MSKAIPGYFGHAIPCVWLAIALAGCSQQPHPASAPPAKAAEAAPAGPRAPETTAAERAAYAYREVPPPRIRAEEEEPPKVAAVPGQPYAKVKVYYGTDRSRTGEPGPRHYFGAGRGELAFGVCEVSIPLRHREGEIERPKRILGIELREDPAKHIVLQGLVVLSEQDFYDQLRAEIARFTEKEALVFIHGFNVTFDDAAYRTAQIAYDVKFNGVPAMYSWPSQGNVSGYTVDETNVEWTVPHLSRFLQRVAGDSGASRIHLIAHSMGNRALTAALRELTSPAAAAGRPLFHEVILAAPDIDADIFKQQILPRMRPTAVRVTLYASSEDRAILASKKVHGYSRAGEAGDTLVVAPGLDTIDASGVDTSLLGHSYYGSCKQVIEDLQGLVLKSLSPAERTLARHLRNGLVYWTFPTTPAGAGGGPR